MDTLEAEVFTTTETIYNWNGDIFTPTHTTILTPATPIQQQPTLSATLNSNLTASIHWHNNGRHGEENDVCQIYIQISPVDKKFGCKHNYTTMVWRDLVDNQTPELVVTTLSAQSPTDKEGEPLGENIDCVHQRMLIYHLESDSKLVEIANVAGCVRQGDLFGVRLEDYDQDGVIGIVAADQELLTTIDCIAPETSFSDNCWQELNTDILIYRWNGTTFTFSERIRDNE